MSAVGSRDKRCVERSAVRFEEISAVSNRRSGEGSGTLATPGTGRGTTGRGEARKASRGQAGFVSGTTGTGRPGRERVEEEGVEEESSSSSGPSGLRGAIVGCLRSRSRLRVTRSLSDVSEETDALFGSDTRR